jgi:hypothetical protein
MEHFFSPNDHTQHLQHTIHLSPANRRLNSSNIDFPHRHHHIKRTFSRLMIGVSG